jgi:hypothetical protein
MLLFWEVLLLLLQVAKRDCTAQSTYVPRVPQCLSPRPNREPPLTPVSVSVAPHRNQKGGGHTRLQWGCHSSDDWRKNLALCLLCAVQYQVYCDDT